MFCIIVRDNAKLRSKFTTVLCESVGSHEAEKLFIHEFRRHNVVSLCGVCATREEKNTKKLAWEKLSAFSFSIERKTFQFFVASRWKRSENSEEVGIKFWGDYFKNNSEAKVALQTLQAYQKKLKCSPVDRDSTWQKLFVSRYVKVFCSSTPNSVLHSDENGLSVFSPKVLFIDSLTEISWRYYCTQWCEKF